MTSLSPNELLSCTELVLVRPDVTRKEIESACSHAKQNRLRGVCVNGSRVAEAYACLEDTDVKVISTIGFPFGAADSDVKRYEIEAAIDDGAQEFEVALNLGRIRDAEDSNVLRELYDLLEAAEERPVSVFLEANLLTREEQILVCQLAVESGVRFLSVVTGNLETIRFLRETVGAKFGIKAGGEIGGSQRAGELLQSGATHLATTVLPEF